MEHNEFVSIEEVLQEVINAVGDQDDTLMNGRGYYIAKIQKAVEFFAINTLYNKVTKDFYNWDKNKNGVMEIPINCFGIIHIYLFNDKANGEDVDYKVVHWKRNLSYGSSGRKMARIGKRTTDEVLSPRFSEFEKSTRSRRVLYANLQENKIIFGDDCSHYKHVRLVYHGFGSELGTIPCIPRIIRTEIAAKAILEVFKDLKVKDRKYRTDYSDAYNEFFGNTRDPGHLIRAQRVISSMDKFKRESMMEYFSNADWL